MSFILLLLSVLAHGESRVVPHFWLAVESWHTEGPLKPEIRAIHAVWEKEHIDPSWLKKRSQVMLKRRWELPPKITAQTGWDGPLSVQAARLDVREPSDDVMSDNIYCYFFITDGAVVSGRVSQIYHGLRAGQGFHFSLPDRALFPLQGGWLVPQGAVIVDYGIVESDGDDIEKLQTMTGVIVDLVVAVYAVTDPGHGQVAIQLRQEVKALADALVSFDQDDRMAIGTLVLDKPTVTNTLQDRSWGELHRSHGSEYFFDRWRYHLTWRLLAQ
jgi:hypothetical protein